MCWRCRASSRLRWGRKFFKWSAQPVGNICGKIIFRRLLRPQSQWCGSCLRRICLKFAGPPKAPVTCSWFARFPATPLPTAMKFIGTSACATWGRANSRRLRGRERGDLFLRRKVSWRAGARAMARARAVAPARGRARARIDGRGQVMVDASALMLYNATASVLYDATASISPLITVAVLRPWCVTMLRSRLRFSLLSPLSSIVSDLPFPWLAPCLARKNKILLACAIVFASSSSLLEGYNTISTYSNYNMRIYCAMQWKSAVLNQMYCIDGHHSKARINIVTRNPPQKNILLSIEWGLSC